MDNFQDELKDIMGLRNPDGFPELPDWYIKPEVTLVGADGNAYNLMGIVSRSIKGVGRQEDKWDEYKEQADLFQKHATSGDYDRLLRACMHWTEVN